MNIVIHGAEFINKGAEAMILTVADALGKKVEDSRFLIRLPKIYFQEAKRFGLVPVWCSAADSPLHHRFCNKIINSMMYLKCRAVVDIGGYQFGDPWGLKRMKNIIKASARHRRLGHLVVFMPQAWGPFTGPGWKEGVEALLDASDLCFVRDKVSMREVEKLIGTNHPKIHFAHDIAWTFKGAPLEIGQSILDQKGAFNERNRICVTPNYRVYERTNGKDADNQYIRFLVSIINYVCTVHHSQVVLLGHEFFKDKRLPDDRTLCNLILSCLDSSLPVKHIDQDLSAPEIKSVIGNCDWLLSSRYHALIAALSQNIPVISLGWSHKYEELMKAVGLDDCSLSLQESNDMVQKKITSVFARTDSLKQVIENNSVLIKQSAEGCLVRAANYIRSGC